MTKDDLINLKFAGGRPNGENFTIDVEVKIFDYNIYRIFRDEDRNIMKIVLERNGKMTEFAEVHKDDT